MITSKRELKKHIDRIQDEVVQVVIPAALYAGLVTDDKVEEMLTKVAQLSQQAKDRLAITFDKKMSAFDSSNAYRKAKLQYYKQAYGKALADYEAGVQSIIDPINAAAKASKSAKA